MERQGGREEYYWHQTGGEGNEKRGRDGMLRNSQVGLHSSFFSFPPSPCGDDADMVGVKTRVQVHVIGAKFCGNPWRGMFRKKSPKVPPFPRLRMFPFNELPLQLIYKSESHRTFKPNEQSFLVLYFKWCASIRYYKLIATRKIPFKLSHCNMCLGLYVFIHFYLYATNRFWLAQTEINEIVKGKANWISLW